MVDNQEEIVQEEVQEEVAPQEEYAQEEVQQPEVQAQEESYQARNFRELREKSERIQRERDEALRRLQEIERAKTAVQEPEDSLNPDDLVEGKHLSKYDKKMAALEKQLQEITIEAKVKNKFHDFDKVVTPDTIAALRDAHPEIAETIVSNPNLYNQAISAYTMIKNLNIYREEKNQKEKQLIAQNNAKPRSVASVSPQQGNSPLTRANAFAEGLTPELKAQMLKEMQQARKGY